MKLTPVEFDPFQSQVQDSGPKLTPVDFDPFGNGTPEKSAGGLLSRFMAGDEAAKTELEQRGRALDAKMRGTTVAETGAAGAASGTLGLAESVYRAPDAARRWAGVISESIEGVTGLPRALNPVRAVESTADFLASGQIPGTNIRRGGATDIAERISHGQEFLSTEFAPFKENAEAAQRADAALKQAMSGDLSGVGQIITDPKAMAGFVGQAAPSLVASYVSGGSIPFMAWMEAMEVSSNAAEFEQRTGQKIDNRDFIQAQAQAGLINGMLEKVVPDALLKGEAGKSALNIVLTGLKEAGTEGAQAFNTNLAEMWAFNPDKELTEGVLPGALGGLGAGTGAGAAQYAANKTARAERTPDGPPADLKAEAEKLADEPVMSVDELEAGPAQQAAAERVQESALPETQATDPFNSLVTEQNAARQSEINAAMPEPAAPRFGLSKMRGEVPQAQAAGAKTSPLVEVEPYNLREANRDIRIAANERSLGDVAMPDGLADARMKRLPYRQGLEVLARDLVKGGGIAVIPDPNAAKGADGQPIANSPGITTPSLNPEWFQTMNATPETAMSVQDVQAAVKKALAGEKLGVRQARVVGAMLDTITGERAENVDHARQQLEVARKTARDGFGYTVPNAGEVFAEQEYAPDWNAEQRMVSELTDEAMQVNADLAEATIERLAIQGASNWQIAEALDAIITGEANEAGQAQEARAEQGGIGRAGEGQGRPEGRAPAGASAEASGAQGEVAPTGAANYTDPIQAENERLKAEIAQLRSQNEQARSESPAAQGADAADADGQRDSERGAGQREAGVRSGHEGSDDLNLRQGQEPPAVTRPEQAPVDRRDKARNPPATAAEVWREAVARKYDEDASENEAFQSLPVDKRREIARSAINIILRKNPLPIDPTSGLANGKAVIDQSRTVDGQIDGLFLEGAINALIQHVKNGGTATLSELDLGNLGGINHWSGQAGGDKAIAQISAILSKYAGEAVDLSRYGGDEFFAGQRDGDIAETMRQAEPQLQEYMRTTTPRMLNPALEQAITGNPELSESEKAQALRYLDTPLAKLPGKPNKDGTVDTSKTTKLHIGNSVTVTANSTAQALYDQADATLSTAKNRNKAQPPTPDATATQQTPADAGASVSGDITTSTGQPFKSQKAAEFAAKARKDLKGQGYTPVQKGDGWVLRKPENQIPPEASAAGTLKSQPGAPGAPVDAQAAADSSQQDDAKKYDAKMAYWDERAAKWGKAKILEEARNAVAGVFLGRDFGESADSFYGRNPSARATRDWVAQVDSGERTIAAHQPKPAPAAAPVIDSFIPTHELPDGTQVRPYTEDGETQPNTWEDADGAVIEDDNAQPIGTDVAGNWLGADKQFTAETPNQYGPAEVTAAKEAADFAKTLPIGGVVLETTIRPNGNEWHVAHVSVADGESVQVSIGSKKERTRADVVAEANERHAKDSQRQQERDAEHQKRTAHLKEIAKRNGYREGLSLGTIVPNTGKAFRGATITKDHGDGTFDVEGVAGNKRAVIRGMDADGIERAVNRANNKNQAQQSREIPGNQDQDGNLFDEQPDETKAAAILTRANVTGKERLDIMRDFRDGKHTLADLEAAYPAKTDESASESISPAETDKSASVSQPEAADAVPQPRAANVAAAPAAEGKAAGDVSLLLQARNNLIAMRAEAENQGSVVDDRLLERIRRQERLIKELEADEGKAVAPSPTVSTNTIFTDDAAAKAREILRKKLGQLNSGLDPEIMQAGITLAGYHVEKGARTFAAYAKAMVADLGEAVKPYLKSWYAAIRMDPRATGMTKDMDSLAEVEKADIDALLKDDPVIARFPGNVDGTEIHVIKTKIGYTVGMMDTDINQYMPELRKYSGDDALDQAMEYARGIVKSADAETADGATLSGKKSAKGSDNGRTVPQQDLFAGDQGGNQETAAPGNRDRQPLDAGLAGGREGAAGVGRVPGRAQGAGAAGTEGAGRAGEQSSGAARDRAGVRPEPGAADDHVIDADAIGKGGLGQKYRDNIAAIKILKTLESEGREATADERKTLAKYAGWGAMKGPFDPDNKQWAKQHTELKELLTDAEFKAARASTLDAHYTSPIAVGAMYDALQRLGFKGGRVLEPSVGIGNFFGLMPRDLRSASQLHGVELDSLTSRLVAALYPKAKVAKATGFQEYDVPAEFFDVVIGNPPFGSSPIVDKDRSPYSGFSTHNYFLAKSVDKLRPGGVMAVVVSHNFLDAQDGRARKWIGERANLIGAVRLPNTAFKENAGTEVVTDILVFQKRGDGVVDDIGAWQEVVNQTNTNTKTGEHVTHKVNQLFVANPKMVLGTPSAAGSMYGANEYTVEPSVDIKEGLAAWVKTLPKDVIEHIDRSRDSAVVDMAVPDGIKVGSFFVDASGKVMRRGDDVMGAKTASEWQPKFTSHLPRMKAMIKIRDALRAQMRLERSPDATDKQIEFHRRELNRLYDAFLKEFKHLNSQTNRSIFLDDTDAHLIQGLEFDYDRGVTKATAEKEGIEPRDPSATKADIFTRRVAFPPSDMMTVSSAKDALLASLNYRGRIDAGYMEEVYGKPMAEIVGELGDVVYDDPQAGIVTADDYLSGDVKTKLDEAKAAAKDDAKYRRNVEALEKVIPKDKTPSEISASIGAAFIPADVYEQFIEHISGGKAAASYVKATGQWLLSFTGGADPALNTGRFGTSELSAQDLLQLSMLGRGAVVKKTLRHPDGSTETILMEKETEAAREKQNAIKAEWQKWLWQDAERADRIASIYNDKMNRIVVRAYDGSHLTFPGMNPAITLLEHQKNGVWRGLQSLRTLYDHVVGAGKTFEMAALAMEMRRMGIARKPLFVVPNHLTMQWRSEFGRLYPGANVLAATPEDFSKDNRERLFAKIITGDWDAVVIGHSSLKKIGLPAETESAVLKEQIGELADAIEDMKRSRGDKRIVADMEKIRKNLEAKMEAKLAAIGQRSKMVTFDELGIDAMFVDEMHEFKNLTYHSTMDRNPGMGNPAGSAKAFDLFVKVRWLFDTFGDKTPFVTATGTPVSNSLVEMFNMQRYMQYPTLKAQGLHVFDAWAKQFGSVENVYEVAPSGAGYRQSTRFAKFTNLPALMNLYNSFADTITLDDLKAQEEAQGKRFPVPKMVGGKPTLIVAKRSPEVAALIGVPAAATDDAGRIQFGANLDEAPEIKQDKESGKWSVKIKGPHGDTYHGGIETEQDARIKVVGLALSPLVSVHEESILGRFGRLRELTKATKGKVNALSLTGEANKAGLDYRLIDPSAPDFPGSKINLAVDNMIRIYKQWEKDKGAQLVFCDLSIPLSARASYSNKERRLFVRDDTGAIEMKRGTMHATDGYESLPYFVVARGAGSAKSFDVYDAASGIKVIANAASKAAAKEAADARLTDERARQTWIDKRQAAGEIQQEAIDDYINDRDVDTENLEFFTREDIAGVSGAAKFSVYDDIKAKLIAKGVKESEIAFIHDYGTPTAKDKLFRAVNSGQVRFLLGSTPKMGAGTNVQKRLVGLHHIDAPWRPSDLEQREGRIIRRGNELYERDPDGFEVFVGRYATEQTYDTRRWQILEHKARGIEQLRNFDGSLNEIDDIEGEAANAADMKAAASGDPLILEETKLRNEVRRLEQLQAGHADEVLAMTRKAKDAQHYADQFGPKLLNDIKGLIATVAKHPLDKDGFATAAINGGRAISDKDALSKALVAAFGSVKSHLADSAKIEYRGLAFELRHVAGNVQLHTPTGLSGAWGAADPFSPTGLVQRLKNYIDRLPSWVDETNANIDKAKTNAAALREQAKQPFAQAADLERVRDEHKAVQRKLMAKGPEVPEHQKAAVAEGIEQQKAKLREMGFGDALDEMLGGAAMFSRTTDQGVTLSADTVQSIMDAVTARLPGSPAVNVIATMDDAPADVRAYDEQQRSEGATGNVEGFYHTKSGEVFLVLDGIGVRPGETAQQAIIRTWAHEVLGHAGLRGAFGKQLLPILKEVALRRRADVKKKAEQYGLDFKNEGERMAAAEEVLAEMAETVPENSLVTRAIEAIRKALRALYLRLPKAVREQLDGRQFVEWVNGMTDAEMIERFILPARRFIETGLKAGEYSEAVPVTAMSRGTGAQGAGETAFSRGTRQHQHLGDLTDAQQQALRNVGGIVERKSPRQYLQDFRQRFAGRIAQGLVDQFAPLKDLDSEAYTLARLSKGSDGALEAVLMFGNLNLKDGVTDADAGGTGLIEVLQQLQGEQQRFMWWIAANRAEGLKAEGRENLFTDEDIAALKALNRGQMPDGQDRAKVYAAVHKEFSRVSKEVMDVAEASNLIDPESRKLWERDFYIPFYRVMEEGLAGPTVKGGLVKQYAFKRLKGGTEKLNADLLANTLMNWGHLLAAAAKNRAATAALEAAEAQGVAIRLTGPQKGSVYIQGMREVEIPAGKKYLDGGVEKVSDGTATMMEHGEIHYLVIDPLIMDAITSLEWAGFNNPAMKAMSKAKHWLTIGVTASPTFKIRNLIRDSLQVIAVADMSYNAAGNVKQGWKAMSNKKGQAYASLLAGGGIIRFGTMLEGNRASHVHKLINAGVHENTILDTRDKLKAAMTKAVDWYNDLGDRSEGANRAAIYLQHLEKGATHAEASLAARDLLDFSMGGSWGAVRFLTQTVPFMNARMQGLYKLGRSAKADKRRFGAVVFTMALASIALMLAYHDDEDWKRREDWDRDNYWWFKIGNTAYRIPKPFEVGALATLAERGAELWVSDEMTAGRFFDRLQFLVGSTFAFNPVPQLFKPAVDVYSNHDPFTGRPIETTGMERLSKPERFTHRTSETAKLIGKAGNVTGLSPAQIDHMIRGYFGWLGTFATGTVDHLADAAGLRPTAPTMKLKELFVAGNFVETLPAGSSRYVTVFYDQAKEINEYYADLKAAEKRGDKEKYRAIYDAHRSDLALHDAIADVQSELSELTQPERAVRFDTRMSAADKRAKLDKIAARKDALATRAVKAIERRRNQ